MDSSSPLRSLTRQCTCTCDQRFASLAVNPRAQFLFNDLDVLALYLVDEEGHKRPRSKVCPGLLGEETEPDPSIQAITAHGFWLGPAVVPLNSKYQSTTSLLSKSVQLLSAQPPETSRPVSSVPSGHMVLPMPGHLGEMFTLIDHGFRRAISTTSAGKGMPPMCLRPMLETVYDIHARHYLLSIWWSRLRLLDPKLLPWPRDATIIDVNPSVLDNDHLIHQSCPHFWGNGFGLAAQDSLTSRVRNIDAYCSEHDRMEQKRICRPLSAQLACNTFEPGQFIALLFE